MCYCWKAFFKKCNPASQIEDVLNSPIWFHSEMQHGGKFFIKNWYEKGIRTIVDLINEYGVFYDLISSKLCLMYEAQLILDFQGVINRIPQVWKNLLNNNIQTCIDMKYNVICSKHVNLILKDKKGCKKIYESFIKSKKDLPNRWQRDLGDISKEEKSQYNSALNDIKEVKLKDFQYKINNRILATNSFLYKINKIDSNRCSFCEQTIESMKHLFVDCPKVKEFWNTLKKLATA